MLDVVESEAMHLQGLGVCMLGMRGGVAGGQGTGALGLKWPSQEVIGSRRTAGAGGFAASPYMYDSFLSGALVTMEGSK